LAEARIVDLGDGEHQRDADQGVYPLPHREEERLSRDVVGRRHGEREAAEADQRQRSAEQDAVEVGQAEALPDSGTRGPQGQRCSFHRYAYDMAVADLIRVKVPVDSAAITPAS